MPRYRYRCSICDDEKVVFHTFDEAPSLNCSSCLSENTLQKVVGNLYFKTKNFSINKAANKKIPFCLEISPKKTPIQVELLLSTNPNKNKYSDKILELIIT